MSKIIFLLSCFFICAISAEKTSEDDCQNSETHGSDYTGTVNQTASGIPCQKWSSQEPHEHEHGDVGDHNYCRNPDGGDGVWCYTTDNETRWQLCDVPFCGNTTTSTTTEASTNSSQTPVVTTPTPATISSTTTDSNITTPTTTTTSNITTPTTVATTIPTTPVTSNTTIFTTTTSTTSSTSTISTTNSSSTSTTTTSTTTTSITTTSTTTASTTTSTISTSTATASTTTSTISNSTATASTTTSTISTSTATASTTTTTQNPVSPARSSSVLPKDGHTGDPDVDSFGPQFAIDGQISTTCHAFFHSALEDYPWLEIKLSSPTEISGVQIVNRRDCCGQRLHKAEIRAGDVSVPDGTQSKPLDINNVCGKYEGPGETGLDPVIKCTSLMVANYVTVQLMAHQSWLQVNELIVQ